MNKKTIDQGIGVILGEYGAIKREGVEGHEAYREYYLEYITKSALEHGLVPVYWDNGDVDDLGFALFDRNSGAVIHSDILEAIMAAIP